MFLFLKGNLLYLVNLNKMFGCKSAMPVHNFLFVLKFRKVCQRVARHHLSTVNVMYVYVIGHSPLGLYKTNLNKQ